jgi:hypothetical protein
MIDKKIILLTGLILLALSFVMADDRSRMIHRLEAYM